MWSRMTSSSPSDPSNRHTSTPVAFSEKRAKFTPGPSQVAPWGYGCPDHTLMVSSSSLQIKFAVGYHWSDSLGVLAVPSLVLPSDPPQLNSWRHHGDYGRCADQST